MENIQNMDEKYNYVVKDTEKEIPAEELLGLTQRALGCANTVNAPLWKEAYMDLAKAASNLENMLARCKI